MFVTAVLSVVSSPQFLPRLPQPLFCTISAPVPPAHAARPRSFILTMRASSARYTLSRPPARSHAHTHTHAALHPLPPRPKHPAGTDENWPNLTLPCHYLRSRTGRRVAGACLGRWESRPYGRKPALTNLPCGSPSPHPHSPCHAASLPPPQLPHPPSTHSRAPPLFLTRPATPSPSPNSLSFPPLLLPSPPSTRPSPERRSYSTKLCLGIEAGHRVAPWRAGGGGQIPEMPSLPGGH